MEWGQILLACQPDERQPSRGEPRPVAGCNMPVTLSLEQTVEALRKREGGTGLTVWQRSAEGDLWSPGVDRTGRVGGGAKRAPRRPIFAAMRLAVEPRRS
jgi:hypothetical protein